ncbi:DUF4352 domain-containing protein [Actinomadura sp. NAK00032]|uniref:DUF4352 domain-containing protein n=1 Tax=Actinomadura sp. NAK00032 TaxID=2742128 RepID=UPI00158FAF39|nr:DUF4352 domain-containing protein [Actinomadura sp. NAK00032]QKW37311.1 DUF4352 domain-containing protein [Actinomadura sp. NAK00032]
MNPNQPHGRRPAPPVPPVPPVPPAMPPFAVPPPRKRGNGCLIAVIGTAAGLFMMVSCVAVVASSSEPSTPAGTRPEAAGGTATADEKPEKKQQAAKKPTREKKVTNGIGRQYRDGKFGFTVTKVKKGVRKVGDQWFGDTAQGQFVIVSVTVKNIGDRSRTFTHHNQTLVDTKGREFEADPEASLWTDKDNKSFLQQINPGNSVKGRLIFDVPRGTRLKAIELHDSMWSGGVTVPLGDR